MLIDTTEHDTVKLNEIFLRIIIFQSWKRIYISVISARRRLQLWKLNLHKKNTLRRMVGVREWRECSKANLIREYLIFTKVYNMAVFSYVTDGLRWLQKVSGWFLVVPSSFWMFQVVSGRFSWFGGDFSFLLTTITSCQTTALGFSFAPQVEQLQTI